MQERTIAARAGSSGLLRGLHAARLSSARPWAPQAPQHPRLLLRTSSLPTIDLSRVFDSLLIAQSNSLRNG